MRNMDMQQLLRLAQSEPGRQLLMLLQSTGSQKLGKAAAMASAGDMEGAREILAEMLSTPEAKALLQQLEGQL